MHEKATKMHQCHHVLNLLFVSPFFFAVVVACDCQLLFILNTFVISFYFLFGDVC